MRDQSGVPGTYLMLLECRKTTRLSIGQLGNMNVVPGFYLYVGSAYGPGGIEARLRHHHKIATRAHWHIDYLRIVANILEVWCVYRTRCEHDWARHLMNDESASLPLTGFGSSDCDCASHLFYFTRRPQKEELEGRLGCKLETLKA